MCMITHLFIVYLLCNYWTIILHWYNTCILCNYRVLKRGSTLDIAGHFWELRSSDFSVVSFVGFQRSGRTRPDQFVTFLALLCCTFKSLNINNKASPIETKAHRRRRDCRTPLSLWCFMVCCSSCWFPDLYMFIWILCFFYNSSFFIQLHKWLINTC